MSSADLPNVKPGAPGTPAQLAALLTELRRLSVAVREEITPEWIATLTDAQKATIRNDLLELQRVAGIVRDGIAAHLREQQRP